VDQSHYGQCVELAVSFDKLGLTLLVIVIAEDDVVYDKLKWLGLPANKLQIEPSDLVGTGTAIDSKFGWCSQLRHERVQDHVLYTCHQPFAVPM
jgi:hypothetical protein